MSNGGFGDYQDPLAVRERIRSKPSVVTEVLNYVVLVIVGAVTAAIATAVHRSFITVGENTYIPYGVFAGLIVVTVLTLGLRLWLGRLKALAFVLGLAVMLILIVLLPAGRSVLFPPEQVDPALTYVPFWVSVLWQQGAVILAALAVIVPVGLPKAPVAKPAADAPR